MPKRAIFFDIDGTLVDSNEAHVDAWCEAFAREGYRFRRSDIHEQVGKGGDNLVPSLLPDVPEEVRERIDHAHGEIYKRNYLPKVQPFSGARDLLLKAKDAGQTVVLASSASRPEVDHYVRLLDAADIIDGATSKDDVGFLSRVIDIAVGGYGADASRVYAAGLSNGGFMAQRLACQLSDRIAAVGVVAAALRNGLATACSGGTPRPISFIVGSADPIVPYAGAGNIRSADATLAFWAARNGCIASAAIINDLPDSTADGTTVRQTIHQVCGSGRDVIRYTVNGGGHAWPGGWQYLPVSVIGKTSTDISASATLLDFFARYTR